MNFVESVNHAKLIKMEHCKICGTEIKGLLDLVATIRDGRGYCQYCRTITDNPNITIDELFK